VGPVKMKTRRGRVAAVALALATFVASAPAAAAEVDLTVHAPPAPPPASLAMRGEPARPAGTKATTATPAPGARASLVDRYIALPAELDQLADQVIFHFQVGQQLEQGQLTGKPLGSGQPVPGDIRKTRFFTIGDVALGTNGLVLTPLSTYLAAHFRFDQDGTPTTTSSPSVYDAAPDASAVLVRSAYGEVGDLGTGWLAPLRLRAGRQFRYGLSVAHFDGLSAWYDGKLVTASAYVGQRVSLFREQLAAQDLSPFAPPVANGTIAGATLDLSLVRRGDAALVLGAEALRWDGRGFGQGTLRWQLTPDAALSSYVRLGMGHLLRWGAGMRARLSRTTTFSLDGEHRLADDLAYDLIVRPRDDSAAAGRFLYLGPRVPELRLAGRAGTVLLDNLDLLLTLAGALPVGGVDSPWSAPYAELGVAVDGRLPSGLSLALILRGRRYFRPDPDPMAPEVLRFGDLATVGEDSVYDAAARMRYAAGLKRFAAEAEIYFHLTQDSHLYRPDGASYQRVSETDPQGGTRFRVEAWIGARARVLAEYEVSSTPAAITELIGLQTLRVLAEVAF
jgi:hypothetical protein